MQDRELLHQFIAAASQDAFSQIVHRHMDSVYAAARRQVRDPQLSEDIAQAVFIILSRKASKLQSRDSLAGWLMKTTHLASLDALKRKSRRERHEKHAALLAQSRMEQNMTPQWEDLSPQLDRALSQLSETDRSAVTLRYLQGNTTAETAQSLGVSEQAAARRISRGIENLRRFFVRQNALSPSASLAIILEQIPRTAAPPALAHGITIAATAGSATPAGLAIANGVIHMMTWNKIVAAMLLLAGLASATGIGVGTVKLLADQTSAPTPPPYARMDSFVHSDAENITREVAVSIHNTPQYSTDPATVNWTIVGMHGTSSSETKGLKIQSTALFAAQTFLIPSDAKTATLHAKVAAGAWTTIYTGSGAGQSCQSGLLNSYLLSSTFQKAGETHIILACTGSHDDDDIRLVAIDRTGTIHPARMISGISTSTEMADEFAVQMPVNLIEQWQLQSRPFNQWIEIRNICLYRGQSTQVNITTSDDNGK